MPLIRAPTSSTSGISLLSALLTYKLDSETLELDTETEFGDRDFDKNWEEASMHTNIDMEDERASHKRILVSVPTPFISLRLNDYLERIPETPNSYKIDFGTKSGFRHSQISRIFPRQGNKRLRSTIKFFASK